MSETRSHDPLETSRKLDHTLQAYGRLERKFAERGREVERLREALDELVGWIVGFEDHDRPGYRRVPFTPHNPELCDALRVLGKEPLDYADSFA